MSHTEKQATTELLVEFVQLGLAFFTDHQSSLRIGYEHSNGPLQANEIAILRPSYLMELDTL